MTLSITDVKAHKLTTYLEERIDHLEEIDDVDVERELLISKIALAGIKATPVGIFHIYDQMVDGTTDLIADGQWPSDECQVWCVMRPVHIIPTEEGSGQCDSLIFGHGPADF